MAIQYLNGLKFIEQPVVIFTVKVLQRAVLSIVLIFTGINNMLQFSDFSKMWDTDFTKSFHLYQENNPFVSQFKIYVLIKVSAVRKLVCMLQLWNKWDFHFHSILRYLITNVLYFDHRPKIALHYPISFKYTSMYSKDYTVSSEPQQVLI